MPEIWMPFGMAMETLKRAVALPDQSDTALEARVRQLSTMGVPRLKRSAANARLRYGITEVAQLAVALVLINGRMTPATAARYVTERWDVFAPATIAGVGIAHRRWPDRAGPYVVIEGNALATLGQRGVRDKTPEPLASTEAHATSAKAGSAMEAMATASWVNTRRFMPAIVDMFAEHAVVQEDIWDSLDRLRQSQRAGVQ